MQALPKAIIFDWDNTLVDTQHSLNHALKNTMLDMGYNIQEEKIVNERPLFASRKLYFQTIFQDRWHEASTIYNEHIRNAPIGQIALYPRTKDVLQFLANNNIYILIVSNKFGVNLRLEVEQMGVSQYCSAVIGSGDTAEDKPSILPAKAALDYVSINPSRDIWFIGDSITDMECARRLGVVKVLYSEYKIHNVIPDFYVKNYDHIYSILSSR